MGQNWKSGRILIIIAHKSQKSAEIEIHYVCYVTVYIVMLFLMLFYDCDASILFITLLQLVRSLLALCC